MLTDADLIQMSFELIGSDVHFERLKTWAKARKIYQAEIEDEPFTYLREYKIGLN